MRQQIGKVFARWGLKRTILVIAVVAIPVMVALLLPLLIFQVSIFDFVPIDSDEIHYWHEILTFSQKGFSGGYYVMEEQIASAKFSRFGPHGPLFPMIYGTLGWFLGWHTYTGLIFNIVAISLSLLIFIVVSKPDNTSLIFLGALLLVFWPLHFYSISVMQESLHQAIAIGIATILLLIQYKGDISRQYALFFGSIIFFAGLLRFTWAFMFLPFFLLIDCPRTLLGYLLSLLKAILLIFISFVSWRYLSSAYEANFITEFIVTFQQSWLNAGKLLLKHILFNINNLISVHNGHLIEVLQRFQILVVIIGVIAISLVSTFQGQKNRTMMNYERWLQIEFPFHLFNLGVFLSIQVIFYDVFSLRDYRVLSSHLLISLLLLLVFKRGRWLIGLIILSNLLFALSFFSSFKDERTSSFVYDRGGLSNTEQILDQLLVYNPEQGPWCNTLLTTTFHSYLVGVPPGIGISYVVRDPSYLTFPLKSKYLLIEHDMLKENNNDYQRFRDKLENVEFLANTDIGNLYLNLAAECE